VTGFVLRDGEMVKGNFQKKRVINEDLLTPSLGVCTLRGRSFKSLSHAIAKGKEIEKIAF